MQKDVCFSTENDLIKLFFPIKSFEGSAFYEMTLVERRKDNNWKKMHGEKWRERRKKKKRHTHTRSLKRNPDGINLGRKYDKSDIVGG